MCISSQLDGCCHVPHHHFLFVHALYRLMRVFIYLFLLVWEVKEGIIPLSYLIAVLWVRYQHTNRFFITKNIRVNYLAPLGVFLL